MSQPHFTLEGQPDATAKINGREVLYFAGCSYLGLQSRAETIEAACDAARQYGLHCATSRGGFGDTQPTIALEQRVAHFFASEAALYLSEGYASALVLLHAIVERFDALFIDECSHYSLQDAAKQSGKLVVAFRHRDANDLAACMQRQLPSGGRPLVISDGVFSVRGTIAPLRQYRDVLHDYASAAMLIDDAHGVGVLGLQGRGTLEHFEIFDGSVNTTSGSLFLCATLSKALGGFGGIIPGSRQFIEHVRKSSHWCDGTTAPPAPVTAASARALELVEAEPQLRMRLHNNVQQLKHGLRSFGFEVDDTPVPIVYLVIGDAKNMQRIQRELMASGVAVAYKPSYSGTTAEGVIRIAVFAAHTPEHIASLLTELQRAINCG